MSNIYTLNRALSSAIDGRDLADRIIADRKRCIPVTVDFAATEYITPSYSNALIMTLMQEFVTPDEMHHHICFQNQSYHVRQAVAKSIDRYERGIRLSCQRAVNA